MRISATADDAVIRSIVGPETYRRGRAYAEQDAVLRCERHPDGRIFGDVAGSRREPYTQLLRTKTTAGRLTDFDGSCTCPVGRDCKHVVALLLVALRSPASDSAAALPLWETALAAVVREPAATRTTTTPLGLQFDLAVIADPATRATTRPVGLSIRPVLPAANGGWKRAGISWESLRHLHFRLPDIDPHHVALLEQIYATCSAGSSQGYVNHGLALRDCQSNQLVPLLAQAQSGGVQLVGGGRRPTPVRILDGASRLTLTVSRGDAALMLRPSLTHDDAELPLASAMFLGTPAHSIVWDDGEQVLLSTLTEPIDVDLLRLAENGGVAIPAADETRFYTDFYPTLRQRIPLVAGSDDVELPEPAAPQLELRMEHLDGHVLQLDWNWVEFVGTARKVRALWAHGAPNAESLAPVLDAVQPMSELFENSLLAKRLAPSAQLSDMSTVRFLTEVLPALEALPGILIDEIGIRPAYREASEAPVVTLDIGTEPLPEADWFDLAVTVEVDGQRVPFVQLFVALAAGKPFLILHNATYFSLDRPELVQLAALITESRALLDSPKEGLRLGKYQVSLWEEFELLGVIGPQAKKWRQSLRGLAGAATTEVPVPAGLQAELRPYQQAGLGWLAFLHAHGLGGILADEMGLGKTIQVLALIAHLRERGLEGPPFLVVAPTTVVHNWAVECRRFTPGLTVATVSETTARRGASISDVARDADIVVTSYTLFRLEHKDYQEVSWAGLFLDEAQNVKNRLSAGYRCARTLAAPFKVAITGTPIENNLMELWSLLSITAPGLYPDPKKFEEYFRLPIEKGGRPELLAVLRRRIKPIMLRRTKNDVLAELPDKQEQVLEVELNPKHRKVYQTYLARERQKVLGLLKDLSHNRFEIFRSLTLLRQASLDLSLVDPQNDGIPPTKLDALLELLVDVVAEGHKVLVFSQFTRFLGKAKEQLDAAGIPFAYLDGRTKRRDLAVERFRSGAAPVFLISLKAGGVGLTLTEADYCILLDPWWNPATEAQAVDRAHRIGQTNKVMVYRLIARDTIEERVMELKAKKSALFAGVLDGGDFSSGILSDSDIRGLLD